ncbi:MAG: transposase [Betaproteobacteria bacterium]|nr:transposase [Betaproteobacteria bacterium]
MVFECDGPARRVRLRTTNDPERINREIKCRTRAAPIFPNTASCLRLVSALLAECDEDWMTGKIYLNLKDRDFHTDGIT